MLEHPNRRYQLVYTPEHALVLDVTENGRVWRWSYLFREQPIDPWDEAFYSPSPLAISSLFTQALIELRNLGIFPPR